MAKKAETKKAADVVGVGAAGTTEQETIGFHKGCLMTLSKERQELARILSIVEQLMQMHAAALQDMGVKLEGELQQAAPNNAQQQPAPKPKKPPIEDIL